jgi:hypothetical protein
MSKAKRNSGTGSAVFYEDRGFLGDYSRDLPSNLAEPLGKAIYAIGRQPYLSQIARDALSFQHVIVKQADEIYKNNQYDPAGYARDFDAVVSEITRGRNGNGRQSSVAERTKREHIVSIEENVEQENYHASQRIIHDLMSQTINDMAVPIHLLTSEDGAIRDIGREGLKRTLSRTVNDIVTEDGNGNRLISPEEVATFLQRFNGNIRMGSVAARLARCRTVDDIDHQVTTVESGNLSVLQYRVD